MLPLIRTVSEAASLLLWAGMWALGGWLIATHVFSCGSMNKLLLAWSGGKRENL